jgi:hypothetical protein
VYKAGRGVDIPALDVVFILIPLYVEFSQYQITFKEIKQAIGRVGRGGNLGIAILVVIANPDISSVAATKD